MWSVASRVQKPLLASNLLKTFAPESFASVSSTFGVNLTKSWITTVRLEDQEVTFKMDTGAEVTAISEKIYHKKLSKPDKVLYGASRQPLPVIGQFAAQFTYKTKSATQQVYVIKGLKNNLLGLPTITALNLIARVDAVTKQKEEIFQQYPSVFKPHSLFTPRSVPLPLQDKVQKS